MTDQPASPESFDWSMTTYQGARREQLRRWAALPLEKMLAALEEMEQINGQLVAPATPTPQVKESGGVYAARTGQTVHKLELRGCAPVPLAHYLKALGILRLVAEQKDPNVKCFWGGDRFALHSTLDQDDLLTFLLDEYRPTPLVCPWNGGSGFYYQERKLKDKDPATGKRIKTGIRDQATAATKVVDQLVSSRSARLANYRGVLSTARHVVQAMGFIEAPVDEQKQHLIDQLRNVLPDDCLAWIDTTVVLVDAGPSYPPLLGTGGNDGNTDFTSNFMQRLTDVLDLDSGSATVQSKSWLRAALLGEPIDALQQGAAIGQFFPSATGGDNSSSGFRADSVMNPWDFLLMIEGALLFAGASVKRLEATGAGRLSAPFCVRPAGVGYASAALADEAGARPEMWMPLWQTATGLAELRMLMSEGRAQVAGRPARNGVDFARAVASLGVDRGIAAFQRYGFHARNGKNYFATPLDRLPVRRNLHVDLLSDCDAWLDSFRRAATADAAPASVARALRQLESAILTLCKRGDAGSVQDVLIALGGCEQAMARSFKWATESYLKPVAPLSPRWLEAADDGSAKYQLAASLASVYGKHGAAFLPLRRQLEPIKTGITDGSLWVDWDKFGAVDVAWHKGDVIEALNAVMARRLVLAQKAGVHGWPDTGRRFAHLADIAAFIEGRINLARFAELLWGLALLDWPQVQHASGPRAEQDGQTFPGSAYALMKLCFAGATVRGVEIPLVPVIHQRASSRQGALATQLAARRLRASGLAPAIEQVSQQGPALTRAAAALLFPVAHTDLHALADAVLRPKQPTP